jgi:hypothetical protein
MMQTVRFGVPLGSISATTFWLGRLERRSETGVRSRAPSPFRAAADAVARRERRARRSGGSSAGASESARPRPIGAANVE